MSTTTTPTIETAPPGPTASGGPRWANRLALFITLLLVLGPLGFFGTRLEIAAWYAAAGQDAAWDKQPELAIEHFTTALSWAPSQPDYLVLRSKQYLEQNNVEAALADAKLAYQVAPQRMSVCEAYSTALLRADRGDEVVKMWQTLLQEAEQSETAQLSMYWNSLAYFQALANQDLDQALVYINKALESNPSQAALLDTRGFVYFRQGKLKEALQDLNASIALLQQTRVLSERDIRDRAIDDRHRDQELHAYRRNLAVIYYHRLLVLEALARELDGQTQEDAAVTRMAYELQAIRDRETVRSLGFTPHESLF